jgi:nucleotide-binding universal stress UspA family protein
MQSMAPISRILVPVDFSDRCLRMMPYVTVFSERYKAEVVLLHVMDPVYVVQQIHRRLCEGYTNVVPQTPISGPLPVPGWILTERIKELRAFGAVALQGIPVRRLVYEGDPEMQIASFIQAEDAQLVIMPTHGYGVFRRFLIGSVTSKVLHDVSCAVLTGVHMEAKSPFTNVTFSNIVCAVDLNPQCGDTLAWASRLAKDFDARLSIVHVIPSINAGLPVTFSSRLKQESEAIARQHIKKLQTEIAADSVGICIREGDVAREVSSFAHSIAGDLIIIGRSSQDGTAGRLRTNAYAIIRQAPCPVVSV